MLNELSTRAKIGITAIAIGLIGGLFAFFAPTIATETLHFSNDNIVLLTLESNLIGSLLSLLVIVMILMLIALKHTKLTVSLATVAIMGVLGFWGWTLTNYIAIQKEQVIVKVYTDEQILKWSDMNEVVYEYHHELPYGQYIFKSDEREIIIGENIKFGIEEKLEIYRLARSFDVAFIEREMTE